MMTDVPKSPLAVYQDHLKQGKLAYQYSIAAQRPVFFPRVLCPYTGDDRLEWRISAGLGTVYSTTVLHLKDAPPYNIALVDCDEGFRLMTRVEDIPPDDVKIGMRVKFKPVQAHGDEDPFPLFTPAG
jgi:uncharacterized OB-fold protein